MELLKYLNKFLKKFQKITLKIKIFGKLGSIVTLQCLYVYAHFNLGSNLEKLAPCRYFKYFSSIALCFCNLDFFFAGDMKMKLQQIVCMFCNIFYEFFRETKFGCCFSLVCHKPCAFQARANRRANEAC